MYKFIFVVLFIAAVSCDDHFDQCKNIWSKWHKADAIETGADFCYAFFSQHPEIIKEFPQFKDVDLAHLKDNREFREHSAHIYHAFDNVFETQNWVEVDNMSELHKQLGKTNKDHYYAFRASFVEWMHLTADQKVHMDACLDKFFEHMFSKF